MSFEVAVKAISSCISVGRNIRNIEYQKRIVSGLDEVLNRLDELNAKTDALILRELVAANKMLDDLKSTDRCDHVELSRLKGMYMLNTGLPEKGSVCGIKNTKIILMSYLGLFQVGILAGENEKLLTRYVLHMFETGEPLVMTDLFPQFCQEVFYPYYQESEAVYLSRVENWRDEKGPEDSLICGATGAFVGLYNSYDENKIVHPKKQLRRSTFGALAGLAIGYGLSKVEFVRKFEIQNKLKMEWKAQKTEICQKASVAMLSNSMN